MPPPPTSRARRGLRRLGAAASLARQYGALLRPRDANERSYVAANLLQATADQLLPGYVVTDHSKLWFEDAEFFERLKALEGVSPLSADRKFFLAQLLRMAEGLPGDTAEAGVYLGASSWFICDRFAGSGKVHYAIDSFEGLPTPAQEDGTYWKPGDLRAEEAHVRELLAPYEAVICKGWIPDAFESIGENRFCFVHVDVDLYEPTLESMRFFYPRLVEGGVIVCDDYGFATCPGAHRAVNEYMADRPESMIHVPTGQGFLVKQ